MLKKLDAIKQRYVFLSEKLADNDTLLDMSLWQKYSKEQAELAPTVEKYDEYVTTEREMNDAFALAEEETDAEMKKCSPTKAMRVKKSLRYF